MYSSGQIIYDLTKKQPVQLGSMWGEYPKRNTHFRVTDKGIAAGVKYLDWGVADVSTVEQAKDLLAKGFIEPGTGRKPIDNQRRPGTRKM